jgi:hypothetical protein
MIVGRVLREAAILALLAAAVAGPPLYVLFGLPMNRVARAVVTSSGLSPADCAAAVAAAEEAAAAQGGWLTDRHDNYPTTDLEVGKIPALAALWESRLAPTVLALVARHFGVPATDIAVDDLFVVRYAAGDGHQRALAPHADSSHVSFNLALNGGFSGGGTAFMYFADPADPASPLTVRLAPGQVLLHHSRVQHAGRDVTAGTRYILVGFLNHSGLAWYQSLGRTWGTLASELHVTSAAATTVVLPVTSMATLLADLAAESVATLLLPDQRLLAGVVALLLVLLALAVAWLLYLLCCAPRDEDDDEDEVGDDDGVGPLGAVPRTPADRKRQ